MMVCKIMINAPVDEIERRLLDYDDLELSETEENWTLIEDYTYLQFFGWDVSSWIELAGEYELIYAYYDELMNGEFIHIQNGVCVRAYQVYDGEINVDEGNDREIRIADLSDIDIYIDKHMNKRL